MLNAPPTARNRVFPLTLDVAPQIAPSRVPERALELDGDGNAVVASAPVDVRALLQPVRSDLARVEQKMQSADDSLFAPLAAAFVDLIGSGGKRLRPALALLAASFGEPTDDPEYNALRHERVIALAAAVEMLHTATLVHDDVIDDALLRRGAPTLNAEWSSGATVLAGNYMFGRAAGFAAETQNMRAIEIFSNTLNVLVNGELTQLSARHDYDQRKDGYYERIYAKTASLFAAATEAAAVLAELPERHISKLKEFGDNLGMAFQIMDDVLDFTGTEESLGKPAGGDLRQGTLTLPFFYYLQSHPAPNDLIDEMEEKWEQAMDGEPRAWGELVHTIVLDLRASNAVQRARQEALAFLQAAHINLIALPDGVHKQSLLGLCDFVVQRSY